MPTYDSASLTTDALLANGSIVGTIVFDTLIVRTANGTEQRNGSSGIHPRRYFKLDTGTVDDDTRVSVLNFFDARRGQSDSFRMIDPFDYHASGEPIVGGRLVKRYTAGGQTYDRYITKPKSGTITFGGGGTLDYETGIISGGGGGTWSGQFEIQARFATDRYTERNFYSDHHEVSVEMVETFDSDIPGAAGVSLGATITHSFPVAIEVGRAHHGYWSTYLVRGGGYSEDRFTQYSSIGSGFEGVALCKNRVDLEALISTFLCVRGRRTAFQYDAINVRFDRDELTMRFNGNESFEANVGFVGV